MNRRELIQAADRIREESSGKVNLVYFKTPGRAGKWVLYIDGLLTELGTGSWLDLSNFVRGWELAHSMGGVTHA